MAHAWHVFFLCGAPSWLCLLVGLMGMVIGFIGVLLLAMRKHAAAGVAGAIALVLGLAAVGVGFGGRQLGIAKVEEVIASLDPTVQARVRAEGLAEANCCVDVGTTAGALPILLGVIALGVGLAGVGKPT